MSTHHPNSETTLVQAVLDTLAQGEELLQELDDDAYTSKLPVAFQASIGGHYRHCLDHFRSLLQAIEGSPLNYDARERNTLVENDRFAALNATRTLRTEYEQLAAPGLSRHLEVTCKTSYSQSGPQCSSSTVGREMMYVVAHAVHHYALMGIMAGLMGIRTPPGFGIAPATLKHRAESGKALA